MTDFAQKVLTSPLNKTHLFYLGQAGFIIKSSTGKVLGIDMYLSECVERVEGHMGFKRLLPKILNPDDIDFDCIIASYPHLDHFDMDSIPQLLYNKKTKLFASVDCEKEVKRLMMSDNNIKYVMPNDSFLVDDFKIDFINCDHGTGAPDAVGAIITVDEKRILFVGDTCLRLDRVSEYTSKGDIDVLIAPINGAYGNLNEKECALLSDAVKPKLTIPCHYGMFASHGGNPGLFFEIMKNEYPNNKVLIMSVGEKFTF